MNNLRCLVYLIGPVHFISAMTAINELHNSEQVEVVILVYHPYVSLEINYEIFTIIKKCSEQFSFIRDVIAGNKDDHSSFQAKYENGYFSEIYYTLDWVTNFHDLLFSSNPKAKKICIGDSLGLITEKNIQLGLLQSDNEHQYAKKNPLINFVYTRLMKLSSYCRMNNEIRDDHEVIPDIAALILPIDQSGNFLKRAKLVVCAKSTFINVVEKCIDAHYELNSYIQSLLNKYKDISLLLTENIAEGNFIDFDREIDMWCSIIRQNCTPGSVVFLKSHPGETLQRNKEIREKLIDEYEIVELEERFKRFPIELWKDLIINCKIISMSYPILSLKYLYDKDVINPMNEIFLEKWFPEWTWRSYKNALLLYMEPLKNLAQWDGKSVLYSGIPKINRPK